MNYSEYKKSLYFCNSFNNYYFFAQIPSGIDAQVLSSQATMTYLELAFRDDYIGSQYNARTYKKLLHKAS